MGTSTHIPHPLGLPHWLQNFPVFAVPQRHTQVLPSGLALPHSLQNLPVLTAPQRHTQDVSAAGFGAPHWLQNFPVLAVPQRHTQEPAAVCPPPKLPAAPFMPYPPAPGIFPPFPWAFICICCIFAAEAVPMNPPPVFMPTPMPIKPAIAP